MRRFPLVLLLATLALSACASRSGTATTSSALPDPCTLLTRDHVGGAFLEGIASPLEVMARSDGSSASCRTTVRTQNGDVDVVITTALDGADSFISACHRANSQQLAGLGSAACWNRDDVSVSALAHNHFYSIAIINQVIPEGNEASLVALMHTALRH